MSENKVVIKINYDKAQAKKSVVTPKMVTVWHTRRILVAVGILLLSCLIILFLSMAGNNESNKTESSVVDNGENITNTQVSEPGTPIVNPISPSVIDARKNAIVKRPEAIILDKHVVRALLSSAPNNDEPGERIKSPVKIAENQAQELFYFVQTKNLKNSILFHRWYKDGQVMSKKQFNVKSNNAKLISSHKLTAKDIGQWQVVLIDKKGKLLSEVNYFVSP
jgi:hypothetical protein